MNRFVAIDPKTGLHLRASTETEIASWENQTDPRGRSFFTKIRVGAFLIDEDTGPGIWFGNAGF